MAGMLALQLHLLKGVSTMCHEGVDNDGLPGWSCYEPMGDGRAQRAPHIAVQHECECGT